MPSEYGTDGKRKARPICDALFVYQLIEENMTMNRFTSRVRKSEVENRLTECNNVYRTGTLSERPLYLIGTLKKRYNPATECKMWTVGRNFGMPPRVLGETLAEALNKLCPF